LLDIQSSSLPSLSRFQSSQSNNADSRITQWYQFGQDQDYPLPNFSANTADPTGPCYPAALFSPTCVTNQYVNVQADHFKVARNISREAITLLKNANNTLPLSTSDTLKIFGSDAENNPAGPNACSERVRLSATFSSLYESCGSCAALKRVLLWNDSGVCSGTFLNQQMLTGDSLGLQHWYSRDGLGKW
jgi:beta-glucosidase-like glycosyl hydrolase